MKKFLKNYYFLFITFFLSLFAVGIIYKLQSVAPFGRNSLLTIDFFHQYGPMLAELYDRIKSGESLIYSFNLGLGIPFFRNFFNYLSSPLNIIMFFFKRENLILSYSIIIAIRCALTGTTMSYFLKKKLNFKNNYIIGLSLLYSFSSYFAAYYWNIMWLDGMMMLPLIVLGIENIVNKDNGILYTVSLIIMLYSNYFISYMICIFSVIYFIGYLIIKTKKFNFKKVFKKCLKFGLCSLLSGMVMIWALVPMFEALKTTNATIGSTMPTSQYYSFTFLEFFKNHLTGIIPTVLASGISNAPNVSTGILTIGLLILFYLNKKISFKRKFVYTTMLLILIASFYIAPLDYIWHAFHVPNDLPYRYSFIYSFIFIIMSAYSLKYIKEHKYKTVLITYIICMLLITYVYLSKYDNILTSMIYVNYALITIYFIIYTLNHFFKKFRKVSIYLFTLIIIAECTISITSSWKSANLFQDIYDSSTLTSTYTSRKNSINSARKKDKELFYRTEEDKKITYNDGAWYDYYGISTFSSMVYKNQNDLQYYLGMAVNYNLYLYYQNTPIYDLIFNVKYINSDDIKDNKRYEKFYEDKNIKTFKYNYSLGLMYGVDKNIKNWNSKTNIPFYNQNDFIYKSTGINNILYKLDYLKKEIIYKDNEETIVKYTYDNKTKDTLYIYPSNQRINYFILNDNLYYNARYLKIEEYEDTIPKIEIRGKMPYWGDYIIKEKVNDSHFDLYISYENYDNKDELIYTINNDKFEEAYNILKNNKLNITSFKEDTILAESNLNKDMSIYTSIPYDEGWNVYVDNKKINTYKINESLLGFDLNRGMHNIKLKYRPKNIYLYTLISILTLISSIIYLFIKKKRSN